MPEQCRPVLSSAPDEICHKKEVMKNTRSDKCESMLSLRVRAAHWSCSALNRKEEPFMVVTWSCPCRYTVMTVSGPYSNICEYVIIPM